MIGRWTTLAAVTLSLASCFWWRDDEPKLACAETEEYQESVSIAGVTTPEGLNPPARGTTYQVPGDKLSVESAAAGPRRKCLDEPPDFFATQPKS
jgi:uncharacterized lipoprotein